MLTPLLQAPFELQVHVAAALLAVALAPLQFLRRKRDRLHKVTGYVWVTTMAVTAISSFWIRDFQVIGEFSPIHVLSVLVLLGLWQAIGAARRGDIATHRRILRQIGVWALGIAGIFTLMPGRLMNEVLFADLPVLGFVAALVTAVILAAIYQFRLVRSGTGRPFR